jgi:predicted transcriptional regulator
MPTNLSVRISDEQRAGLQSLADGLTGGNVSALIQSIADGEIPLAKTDQQQEIDRLWAEVQQLRTSLIANQRQWVECCERMDRQWEAIVELRKSLCK